MTLGKTGFAKSIGVAFEQFMRPHFELVYARACRLTHNVADAEDLVQELCLRVFRSFGETQNLDNPRAWLLRILYRLYLDARRRDARSPIGTPNSVELDESSAVLVSAEPGPQLTAEASSLQERLQKAMDWLRPEERALLVMREVEGYSLGEMEEITGLSQSAVKSRLHRARIRLGRLLQRTENELKTDPKESNDELSRYRASVG